MVEGYIVNYDGTNNPITQDYDNLILKMESIGSKNQGIRLSKLGESSGTQGAQDKLRSVPKDTIYAIDFFPQREKRGQVFIVAGHHVIEPAGIVAALEFAEKYKHSNSEFALRLKKHYQVTVVPLIDIDEYKKPPHERANFRKLNLHYDQLQSILASDDCGAKRHNLKHVSSKDPSEVWDEELIMGRMVYQRTINSIPFISFDLHEHGKYGKGFFLYAYSEDSYKFGSELMLSIENKIDKESLPVHSEVDRDMPRKGRTFSEFLSEMGGLGLTFESPLSEHLHNRVRMHISGIDELIYQWLMNIEMDRI